MTQQSFETLSFIERFVEIYILKMSRSTTGISYQNDDIVHLKQRHRQPPVKRCWILNNESWEFKNLTFSFHSTERKCFRILVLRVDHTV